MSRESVEATPRTAMTAARRRRTIEKSDGHCAYPECQVAEGLEIDHTIALELGGKEDDSNLQALCVPHHKQKTALDIKLIAKSRRLRLKAPGQPRKPSRLRSRGFDKSRRRHMDGTVSRRGQA